MLFATVNSQLLAGAQIHKAGAALRLQNEVQLFLAVFGQIHRPVRIVGANRCLDLEAGRDFEEHLYIGIIVQRDGERALNETAVIDNIIVDAVFHLDGVAVEVGDQFCGIENFLHIILFAVQFDVTDTVNRQRVAVVLDDFCYLFQKGFRVVQCTGQRSPRYTTSV